MNEKKGYDFPEIMTINEIANYLKISEKSVLRMAQKAEIPVTKVASQWRFMKTVIDEWLISRMTLSTSSTPSSDTSSSIGSLTQSIELGEINLPFSRLLKPELMVLDLKAGTKEEVLDQLVKPLKQEKLIKSEEDLVKMLLERESMVSTAIGHGIAMPHVREPKICPVANTCVVLGLCKDGTDFDSIDNKKTFFFFVILTRSEIVHLKIMARIAYLTKNTDFLNKIREAKDRKDVTCTLIMMDQKAASAKK